MTTFKDNEGRTWVVAIHVTAVKRCRALAGVDLYGLVDDGFAGLAALVGDPIRLVDVLYVLCADEAQKRGVGDEDFGRGMAGDALAAAADAFLEELTDFFPDPRVRAGLKQVIAANRKVTARLLDHLGREIDRIDPDAVASGLIASSGSWPAPSASTPAPSL